MDRMARWGIPLRCASCGRRDVPGAAALGVCVTCMREKGKAVLDTALRPGGRRHLTRVHIGNLHLLGLEPVLPPSRQHDAAGP